MKVAILVLIVIAFLFIFTGSALGATNEDANALIKILQHYGSPLPWWTIWYFKNSHPDFDIAGYLAVVNAESSLGKAKYPPNNVGCIKFGGWLSSHPDLAPWHRWMNGYWHSYGTYSSVYWGQRAAIRLIYDRGYNAYLAAHDWWGFANRYYGAGVSGIGSYVYNLKRAHNVFVSMAAEYGASW